MANDPYANTIRSTGFTPPHGKFSLPPIDASQGAGNASLEAFQFGPEELERMIAQGYVVHEDGSMSPPNSFGSMAPPQGQFTSPMPSMGAMRGAERMGGVMGGMEEPKPPGMFDNPIFAPHMNIRNPQPEQAPFPPVPPEEPMGPREGMNLSVPGGASIVNGMPQAAPPPPANIKTTNTYNVAMAPDAETAGRQFQTEQMKGTNAQSKRDYEEMARSRKVGLIRGFVGRR